VINSSADRPRPRYWVLPVLLFLLLLLQGLAASGLRAMRYACEVDGVGEVVALDKDPGEDPAQDLELV